MRLIETIQKNNYETISIIGLAKNAGKTVTLNYLIEEAYKINIKIGITSTGRDGENTDLVTETQKPSIEVTEGMYVATAKKHLCFQMPKLKYLKQQGYQLPWAK